MKKIFWKEQASKRDELTVADRLNEQRYLAENPDVRAAMEKGQVRSGFSHWLNHGRKEGRMWPERLFGKSLAGVVARLCV